MSKFASSRYRSGRSRTWLKCKCFTESSFVIIGTDRDHKIGAMLALLARADRQGLATQVQVHCAVRKRER